MRARGAIRLATRRCERPAVPHRRDAAERAAVLRIGVVSPGDGDAEHSVTYLSEGTGWQLSDPSRTKIYATLRGQSTSGMPVQVRLQVLAPQGDTF